MSASSSRPSGYPPVMSRRDLRGDAYRVFELVAKDPVLLGHDLERLACAEQGQRVVQPAPPRAKIGCPKPRDGSTINSATSYAGSRIKEA